MNLNHQGMDQGTVYIRVEVSESVCGCVHVPMCLCVCECVCVCVCVCVCHPLYVSHSQWVSMTSRSEELERQSEGVRMGKRVTHRQAGERVSVLTGRE